MIPGLWLFALLTNLTSIQRILRAKRLLQKLDAQRQQKAK
jgi:hypothetical protein